MQDELWETTMDHGCSQHEILSGKASWIFYKRQLLHKLSQKYEISSETPSHLLILTENR